MEENKNTVTMSLIEHLGELRKRLIRIVILFLIFMIVGFFFAEPVVNYIKQRPPVNQFEWHVFTPVDALSIYIKVAFIISFVMISPIIMLEVWGFVSPALTGREKRTLLSYIPFAVLMFIFGIGFSFYILLPMVLSFMSNISHQLGVIETYGMVQYFSFLINMVLPFGILFQLPIVVMFLASLGILNPVQLRRFRRYAYFVLVVTAVIITPPDFSSDFLVTVPLIILYELSIWLTGWVYKRKLRQKKVLSSENLYT